MTVLSVGVDSTTVEFLKQQRFNIEVLQDLEEFDLEDWISPSTNYEAVLLNLDIGIGVFACRGIRRKGFLTPVVGLSAQKLDSWSEQRATFLDQGGDDLLQAPANPRELTSTIRAVIRRTLGGAVSIIELVGTQGHHLKVNLTNSHVHLNGIIVYLTYSEYKLLALLISAPKRTFSKEQILAVMYAAGIDEEAELKIIDVYICKLRSKFAAIELSAGKLIETVWGRGYTIQATTQTIEE